MFRYEWVKQFKATEVPWTIDLHCSARFYLDGYPEGLLVRTCDPLTEEAKRVKAAALQAETAARMRSDTLLWVFR